MTMVKTKAVASARHAANVERYLNDERAVARETLNVVRPERWADEMARTRAAYGHDAPSRAGAACTVMYHQVLAWLPDDCDMHGGPMTAEACMAYAREWCVREYPDQEVAIALHRERAANDGTERWAAHLAVNRTCLETGLRYNPGLGHVAASHRARLAREMDAERGLTPTRKGRVSRVHERQAPQPVREMRARGEVTWRDKLAEMVRKSVEQACTLDELCDDLAAAGVTVRTRGRREISYQLAGHNPVRGSRLAVGSDRQTIDATIARNASRERLGRAVESVHDAVWALYDAQDAALSLREPPARQLVERWENAIYGVRDARRAAESARGLGERMRARKELREAERVAAEFGGEESLRSKLDDAEATRKAKEQARQAERSAKRALEKAANAAGVAAHNAGEYPARVLSSALEDVDEYTLKDVTNRAEEAYRSCARNAAEQRQREASRQRSRARQIDRGMELGL